MSRAYCSCTVTNRSHSACCAGVMLGRALLIASIWRIKLCFVGCDAHCCYFLSVCPPHGAVGVLICCCERVVGQDRARVLKSCG